MNYDLNTRLDQIEKAITSLVEIAIVIDKQDDRNLEYFDQIQKKHNILCGLLDKKLSQSYNEISKLEERLANVERELEFLRRVGSTNDYNSDSLRGSTDIE